MTWRHTKLALATLLVNGRTYSIGIDGTIAPDPTDDDRVIFARMPEVVDMNAPVVVKPKKTSKRRPAKKGTVAKK
jgi:hypothetical protein